MQRTTLLLTLLAVPCLTADDGEPRLHFKANGYSIAPLDEASDKETCQALMMFLPPSGGFAPTSTSSSSRTRARSRSTSICRGKDSGRSGSPSRARPSASRA
jgi:hypothetical protein